MKRGFFLKILIAASFFPLLSVAQNPIVQTYYTADPAPMVHNGTVYVYTSHDEDSTVNNFFTMYDWRCYSTTDMVNWTDHGAVASLKNFGWMDKSNGAWAPQCIERNGKFYLYVPIHGEGIAVLVSDSPTGPFSDPIGKRLVDSDHIWQDIDPTVAIDWAIAQNSDKASILYNKIDVSKIAVSGMSCGGLQTLEVAPDPQIKTAIVCNSGILGNAGSGMPEMPSLTKEHLAKLHTPTLYLLGGESDIAYKNGVDDFNRINHVPVFVANMNVGHGGTYGQPHGTEFAKVATAWYRWQLYQFTYSLNQ